MNATNLDCSFQNACAQFLLPILLTEQEHITHSGLIRRPREVEYRVLCGALCSDVYYLFSLLTNLSSDICSSTLFVQTWFCPSCGREICASCRNPGISSKVCTCNSSCDVRADGASGAQSHLCCKCGSQDFLPVTRFDKCELERAITEMLALRVEPPLMCVCIFCQCMILIQVNDLARGLNTSSPTLPRRSAEYPAKNLIMSCSSVHGPKVSR